MLNEAVTKFFDERKEVWLKNNLKPSLSEEEVLKVHEMCTETFSLEVWLPNAARRAGQISMSTHPCTFSHPSARKNKNGYVTSVIAEMQRRDDGFLRSGNAVVQSDALGNAAALDVHKFLSLEMPDGRQLIEHIKKDSDLAKSLLTIKSKGYETLKSEFLEMTTSSTESVTSSKIKQVYFPVEDDYHQLSVLSNSGMIYHLRKRLDELRFGEKLKELREKKKKNAFSDKGYAEIYNLTTIAYGGTKPQNISVLNSQNGGKSHLLFSMPPALNERTVHFPKHDFFSESIKPWSMKSTFTALHKIYQVLDYSNVTMRDARKYYYEQLLEKIIEQMWAVRQVSSEQYYEKTSQLKGHQKTWLLLEDEMKREHDDEWLEKVVNDISLWIMHSYKRLFGKSAIDINGKEELMDIEKIVEKHKEALR